MNKFNLLRASLLINVIAGFLLISVDLNYTSLKNVLVLVSVFSILFAINHKALTKMSNEEVKKLMFC